MNLTELRGLLEKGVRQPAPPLDPGDMFRFKNIPCEDGRPGCHHTPTGLVRSMTKYEWKFHTKGELLRMPFPELAELIDKLKVNVEVTGFRKVAKEFAVRLVMKAEEQQDPNRDKIMCERCAEEYIKMMEEQWDEYYHGRI